MRVAAALQMLSETTKQAILEEQDKRVGHSPLSLAERLRDADYLTRLYHAMSKAEQEVIRLFFLEAAQGFFSKRQWDRLNRSAHTVRSLALNKLRRLGIVLTLRKLWGEVGYGMPRETRKSLFPVCLPLQHRTSEEKALVEPLQQAPVYYIPSGRGIHLDIVGLLLGLREHPVQLTRNGTVPQRHLLQWTEHIALRPEHVTGWLDRLFPSAHKAGKLPQSSVLLDLMMRLQLIRPQGKMLSFSPSGAAEWLENSPSERRQQIKQMLLEHYVPEEPWFEALLELMDQQPPGNWQPLDLLLAQLRSWGYGLPEDAESVAKDQWLHPLLGFGWIELGEDADSRLWWRWSSLDESGAGAGWYLEPGGVLLALPGTALADIWRLSETGALSFAGSVVRCKLEASRVQAWIGRGGRVEEILELLQGGCLHPLPEIVIDQVRRWAEAVKRIRLEAAVKVTVGDPRLLEELAAIPVLRPYMQEVIAPDAFLVSPEQYPELLERLRQCGYAPGLEPALEALKTRADMEPAADPVQNDDAPGLFASERSWTGYKVENVFPELYENVPQLAALPGMWTRHFQAYHPQTLRDMCKRAQELAIEILVEDQHGAEWRGVPTKVEVEMGYWYVTLEHQRKRKRYRLEEIRKARIQLPDVF